MGTKLSEETTASVFWAKDVETVEEGGEGNLPAVKV